MWLGRVARARGRCFSCRPRAVPWRRPSPISWRPARTRTAAREARIRACTWIIDKAKDDEDIRAEAHLQRGVLHELAGDREAADQGLQRGDRDRRLERARLLQSRQCLRPARASSTVPSPTTRRRSSSIPPIRTSSTIAARPTTARASTIWRLPTTRSAIRSIATTAARLLQPRPGARQQGRIRTRCADFDQAIRLSPHDADAYAGPRRHARGAGQRGRRAADYEKPLEIDARARRRQGGSLALRLTRITEARRAPAAAENPRPPGQSRRRARSRAGGIFAEVRSLELNDGTVTS